MSEAVMQRLKISREGVILIKSFEGFRPRAIRRADGQWTIGYGHTASARDGASVSEADAELLLQYDLIPIARALNEGVAAPLNQHQFDALASFAFSVGLDRFQGSDVLSRLNAGLAGEAADALVGWPEPVLPEAALRRRAAERALFVADPASPVALSDLLAAPLPPPAIAEPPVVEAPVAPVEEPPAPLTAPEATPASEDAEAPSSGPVVALLSDPAPVLHQPEGPDALPSNETGAEADDVVPPSAANDARHADAPEVEASEAGTPEGETAVEAAPEPASFDAADDADADADAVQPAAEAEPEPAPTAPFTPVAAAFAYPAAQAMQRYSAYPGAIIGPLPAPLTLAPAVALAEREAEPHLVAATDEGVPVAPEPEVAHPDASRPETVASDAVPADTVDDAVDPFATTPPPAAATDLSAPWGAAPVVNPFAGAPVESEVLFPDFAASAPAVPLAAPWAPITADSEPRTDGALVLTAPAETDVFASSPRLVWPHEDATGDAPALFEDDGSLRLAPGNIIRHEPFEDTPPARIPWGELGAYGLMGAFGLVSFGMSMAAFRRASQATSDADGVTLIAIVLAVIGAACVGVSAYNLYRRWGRADDDQPTL